MPSESADTIVIGAGVVGLAIARQLVQAHGGRIGVASEPGQGTAFTIELAKERPPSSDQQNADER